MATYTKTTNFTAKDNLTSGDPAKVIKGSEFDTEFNAIETAVNSKANANNGTHTGTTTISTANIDTLQIDGVTVTSTSAELNKLDGFTGDVTDLNKLASVTATATEINVLDGSTATTADLNKLAGVTATSAELNLLDGVTATTAELNFVDGVTSNVQTQLNAKQPLDAQLTDIAGLTPADGTFIVGNGTNFVAESGDTAIASLGITATATELNTLDGITATTAELNITDGLTATTAELNVLDGITATTTELNYTDGVTSNIQTQLDTKAPIASPTFTGTTTIPAVDINGGNIDDVQIGTTTPNAGVFSTLNANSSFEAPNIDDNATKVDLKNGGATKLSTTATGVTVTGEVVSDGLSLGDNDKATFGASDDLQIYHSGTHSYISDQGTGNLRIICADFAVEDPLGGDEYLTAARDGALTAYYNGSAKLATTATGVDVTGTVTADGLTVDGSNSSGITAKLSNSDATQTGGTRLDFEYSGTITGRIQNRFNGGDFQTDWFGGNSGIKIYGDAGKTKKRFDLAANGDIQFFEDTGTTAKFHWDSSAESLTIDGSVRFGYNQGAETNAINWAKGSNNALVFESTANPDYASGSWGGIQFHSANGYGGQLAGIAVNHRYGDATERQWADGMSFLLKNGGSADNWSEVMSLRSSGNVGIGTSSPEQKTHIRKSSGYTACRITSGTQSIDLYSNDLGTISGLYTDGSQPITFHNNSTERARIDSSGNLLVGKTSADGGIAGAELRSSGQLTAVRDSAEVAYFNRLTNDGDILIFAKGGSGVGSIGTYGNTTFIQSGSNANYAGLLFNSHQVEPCRNNGSAGGEPRSDNSLDLGSGGYRFDDIYATNAIIQTSDRNEKQDIETLSDAEQRVAVACKGLLRKFRWKDAVEEKGDEARIHFGIIAQDLQDAFEAEGLDAGRYAMFISSTWTDEETGEERTRLGVRYPELLAFIIASI